MITKTLLAIAGIAVVGVVGYKIIKKKNPDFFKNCTAKVKESTNNLFEGASEAFKEGYASANAAAQVFKPEQAPIMAQVQGGLR